MSTLGLSTGKYGEAARLSLMSNAAYVGDFLTRSLLMVVFLFTFAQIWTKTLPGGAAIAGLTATELVWYLALTETVMLSMGRLEGTIVSDVKTGALAYLLAKPMDYIAYQYAGFLGETALRVGINGVIGATTAWVLVGPLHTTAWAVGTWLLGVVLGASLSFHMAACIGLMAFWVEDVVPFFWIYNKLLFTLGGLFAPVAMYPGIFRTLAEWSPFYHVFAAPAHLLVSSSPGEFARCVAWQSAWLLLFVGLSRLVFRRGVRRVDANGG